MYYTGIVNSCFSCKHYRETSTWRGECRKYPPMLRDGFRKVWAFEGCSEHRHVDYDYAKIEKCTQCNREIKKVVVCDICKKELR